MKKTTCILLSGILLLCSCGKKSGSGKIKLQNIVDSASYVFGVKTGEDFAQIKERFPDFNYEIFMQAIQQTLDSAKPIIDMNNIDAIIMSFQQKERTAAIEKNEKEEKDFMEANKSKPGVKTTESGLQYEMISEGTGLAPATLNDTVVAHYKGTFVNGKEFDNSFTRGMPWDEPLSHSIKAWQEVMPLLKAGTKLKLYSPAALAYGERSQNKMMIFEIEVLEVKRAK